VATITLDRPEKANALTSEEIETFVGRLHDVRTDPAIRVALITGAGDRAFCAGMDWNALEEPDLPNIRYYDVPDGLMTNMPAYFKGIDVWKPVVAAVNGHAIALGAHIVLGADIRVASTNATIAFSEVLFGDIADGGGIARLTRQLPYVHAMDLLLTGRRVGADEMLRMGLVNEVVAPNELVPRARAIARHIAVEADPHAAQITKRAVVASLDVGQTQALQLEALFKEMLKNRLGPDHDEQMLGYSRRFRGAAS